MSHEALDKLLDILTRLIMARCRTKADADDMMDMLFEFEQEARASIYEMEDAV